MRFTVHPHEHREQFLSCMFWNKHCQSYQANEPGCCFFYHSQKCYVQYFQENISSDDFFLVSFVLFLVVVSKMFARSHLREEIIQFDLQVALNLRKLNIRNFTEQMLNFYWIQVASKKPQETVRQLATNTCCITRHGRLQEGETSLTSQRFTVLGGWFPCFHVQRFIFFWWW